MSKLKLILVIISSAIAGVVLFIAAIYGYTYFKYKNPEITDSISSPPPITSKSKAKEYLGIIGATSGQFKWKNSKKLSPGKGKISGHILKNGAPCEGVKIKLLFNGNAISGIATSDKSGQYTISVPYGEYRIDGWQLELQSANEILDGKILEPRLRHNTTNITISESNQGVGPSLNFINPITIFEPKGIIEHTENIQLKWSEVKGTKVYRIQIIDRGESLHGADYRPLFETYKDRPITPNTTLSANDVGITLSKGHYYTLQIEALNDINEPITESPNKRENGFFIKK